MKFSIITINFNNLEGLKKTAESVINQTWKEFEWIIIDGGSTDGSKEYIVKLNDDLTRNGWNPIAYWCSEPDKGIYNAMNKGIGKAKGEYLLFLNSGDYLYGNWVIKEVITTETGEDFLICHLDNIREIDVDEVTRKLNERQICIDTLFESPLPQPSTFIRKDLFLTVGTFDEEMKICSDMKFFIEAIVYKSATYRFMPLVLTVFDRTGISSNFSPIHSNERSYLRALYFPPRVQQDYLKYRDLEDYIGQINSWWLLKLCLKILHRISLILSKQKK